MMRCAALHHLRKTYLFCSVVMFATPFAQASTHHVVEAGETLSGIAAQYNLSTTTLIDANGLEASYIRAGEVLNIPHPDVQHNIYRVVAGDNLTSLAKQYNLSVNALAEANHMSPQSGLMIGSTLVIPVNKAKEAVSSDEPDTNTAKPTAKAKITPQQSSSAPNQIHRIEYGETLFSIANKYNVRLGELAAANNMSVDDVLYFGHRLTIPSRSTASKKTATPPKVVSAIPKTYTVKSGDTLMGIANRYQVNFLDIATKSNISPYDALAVGQVLHLPAPVRSL